jgi:hypothetical protein
MCNLFATHFTETHTLPAMYLPTLTEPEKLLLAVAARVDTAIRFKEANPGQDYGHYSTNLAEEAVSLIFRSLKHNFVLIFSRNLLKVYTSSILQDVVISTASIPLCQLSGNLGGWRGTADRSSTLMKSLQRRSTRTATSPHGTPVVGPRSSHQRTSQNSRRSSPLSGDGGSQSVHRRRTVMVRPLF